MNSEDQPASKVTVHKRKDGTFWFELTFRGVTRPAHGPYKSQLDAAVASQIAFKALQGNRR